MAMSTGAAENNHNNTNTTNKQQRPQPNLTERGRARRNATRAELRTRENNGRQQTALRAHGAA
eukprot:4533515-Lingulodinium_polyedra.AAC.1